MDTGDKTTMQISFCSPLLSKENSPRRLVSLTTEISVYFLFSPYNTDSMTGLENSASKDSKYMLSSPLVNRDSHLLY